MECQLLQPLRIAERRIRRLRVAAPRGLRLTHRGANMGELCCNDVWKMVRRRKERFQQR